MASKYECARETRMRHTDVESAGSETSACGRTSVCRLNYGRARESRSAAPGTPGAATIRRTSGCGAPVAGGARPASAVVAPGSAGNPGRDRGPGRDLAPVPVRDRARPQGALERDDRGPGG